MKRFNLPRILPEVVRALLWVVLASALAVALTPGKAIAADEFLPPEEAFRFSASMPDANTVEVRFAIADGYYMYRERFAFRTEGAKLGEAVFPQGVVKYDETFQKDVETYKKQVSIRLPVEVQGQFTLAVTSQGCSDKGLCYPPMESKVQLPFTGKQGLLGAISAIPQALSSASGSGNVSLPAQNSKTSAANEQPDVFPDSEMGRIEASLQGRNLSVILPLFLLLGLGLSFTPCVLPMVPILSSIIVGEGGQLRRSRGFMLSVAYSLGMALVYTALGVAAGLAGEGLGAQLQNPWALSTFALLMVILSLSMFGVYQLQVPAALQAKLMQVSSKQANGKLFGVFLMGAISALIVGPCVAAPLAGILVYIGQTKDVVIGGSALFAMAIGMSVPLLLVGVSAGTLLPRTGAWMELVKRFFGVLLLAVALWMISPVVPAAVYMLGWALIGIGYGMHLLWMKRAGWLAKAFGVFFVILGAIQLIGLASGGRDAFAPLAHLRSVPEQHVVFERIKSEKDLEAALAKAKGKIIMLDFYADWCVSCKEMEKFTFSDSRVRAYFDEMQLLQIDVTANNEDDKAMLKRFNLFGPPGIIFFNQDGQELRSARVIGYQNAEKFLVTLKQVTQP
ncbi:protein-disulfide reductase DsbD [Oxalobacteraceae bacterium R-40]|uniref:Thiol:disulfide interchange protein DsbD n=1 Tax=Keguizhuia sedimenti TaxID=3064264 RepID=A0ABU1BRR3_9BURK|nr:protein-disulfide reductase DsbD [Oxalobacteraceae bacterium R-40]